MGVGDKALAHANLPAAGPVLAKPSPASAPFENAGDRSHERAILQLQQTAGNSVATGMLGRIQRAPNENAPPSASPWASSGAFGSAKQDDPLTASILGGPVRTSNGPSSKAVPDQLVLRPDDSGRPAKEMDWNELQDAIDENETIIGEQIQTTPDRIRRERRLDELKAAQAVLAGKAMGGRKPERKGRRDRASKPKEMPPKPETLAAGRSIDYSKRSAAEINRELDLVVRYLAAGPSNDERQILEAELPSLEQAAGKARQDKREAKRAERLGEALTPAKGDESAQLTETLSRVQNAERDGAHAGIWLIHHDGKVFQIEATELVGLRQQIAKALATRANLVNGYFADIEGAWEERDKTNREHNWVHGIASFRTDVADISATDISSMSSNAQSLTGKISREARAGLIVEAGDDLLMLNQRAQYWAGKVGHWESELVSNAGMVVFGLQIAQLFLSLMAGYGAARLATLGGGGFLTTLKAGAQIAGMTTGTGLVAGTVGAAVSGRDVKKGARGGTAAGFGVGVSALTAGLGQVASVRDAAKVAGIAQKGLAIGKAVTLETVVNVGTSSIQAGIEGGDVKQAALNALIATPLTTLGGGIADAIATGPVVNTIMKTSAGAGAGYLGAAGSGGDRTMGAIGGAAAPLYGGAATALYGPKAAPVSGPPGNAVAPGPALGSPPAPAAIDVLGASGGVVKSTSSLPTLVPGAGAVGSAPAVTPGPASALPIAGSGSGSALPGSVTTEPAVSGPGARTELPGADDVEAAFANLGDLESGHLVQGSADAPRGARVSPSGVHELDLGGITRVSVRDGPAPLQPGDKTSPALAGQAPPETWLVDPKRANVTDPAAIADTDFKPNRTGFDYDARNVQLRAGPGGEAITTPTGPDFAGNRVVGGARGATLDPATGTWAPGSAPYERPHNQLGQDAPFQERTPAEWHALEQGHGALTDEQRYALWFYSDDLSGQINPALRGQHAAEFVTDPTALAAAASDLDRTMQPVPFDTIVHRKATIADFSDLGVTDPTQLTAMAGKSYAHRGYTSTAIEAGHWSGDIDIVIQVPKGTRGRYLGGATASAEATNPLRPAAGAPKASMPGEMEFLVERGTTFTIQKAEVDPSGRWRVEVRIAEQGIKPKPLGSPVPLPGRSNQAGGGPSAGIATQPQVTPGTFPPRAPGPDITTPGTFPPRAPGPDTTTPGTFPPRAPGPDTTGVQSAAAAVGVARQAREAAEARLALTQQPANTEGGGGADPFVAQAGPALEVAQARLVEARAARNLADVQLTAVRKSGAAEGRLALEASLAKAVEGDAEVALGQAQTQAIRARRVAEAHADMDAASARRTERANVEAIDDPEIAARIYVEQRAGAGGNVAMTRREVFDGQWREYHRQTGRPPAAGWRRADGTVVVDASNPQVRAAIERLARERRGGGDPDS